MNGTLSAAIVTVTVRHVLPAQAAFFRKEPKKMALYSVRKLHYNCPRYEKGATRRPSSLSLQVCQAGS